MEEKNAKKNQSEGWLKEKVKKRMAAAFTHMQARQVLGAFFNGARQSVKAVFQLRTHARAQTHTEPLHSGIGAQYAVTSSYR